MMDACMATNPIMMQRRDIEELYEAIL